METWCHQDCWGGGNTLTCFASIAGGKEVREESCQLRISAAWERTWLAVRVGVHWGGGAGGEG